jgi:hypothetical protein
MTSRAGQTILWASYNYPTYVATSTENSTFYYGPDRQYFRQDYSGPSISETTRRLPFFSSDDVPPLLSSRRI